MSTNSISLDIVLENFATSADTVSKVTIGITGVNSSVKTEYTISSTINLAGNSSVTLTYPDDFNAVTPIFSFINEGLSTITVSTTSVSSTGDIDTDNDSFYIVGKVFNPSYSNSFKPSKREVCEEEELSFLSHLLLVLNINFMSMAL